MARRRFLQILGAGLIVLLLGFLAFQFFSSGEPLAGFDKDNDGVRDDVQSFIEQTYSDPKLRIIGRELHKAIQQAFLSPESAEPKKIIFAQQCLDDLYPQVSGEVGRDVEARTANTRERIKTYWKANARLSGTILPRAG